MGTTAESLPPRSPGVKSTIMKVPVSLQTRGCRILVDPDGSVGAFISLQERRALFGYEQLWLCKVQAGIVIHAQRPDWVLRPAPRHVQLAGKVFDGVEVMQSVEFYRGRSLGYLRRLKLRNGGSASIRLRVFDLFDPTAANFGDIAETWGSLGVNAFNRESHVAMDEVSDPPSARVVGSVPSPSRFYMTTDRSRAQQLLSAGELPEGTAGMSGQVLVLSSHELELGPGEAKEITFASLYSPDKLEDVLSDFGHLQSGERQAVEPAPIIACSDPALNEAAAWAVSEVEAGAYSKDSLDRYEVLKALTYLYPSTAKKIITDVKGSLRKDGSLPHSMNGSSTGMLETAIFLQGLSRNLTLAQDKKVTRALYPTVKKLASFLLASSKEYAVQTDPSLPQGWRRCLGRGFPTGEIPEVTLAVAGGLAGASQVARLLSRSDDAARFRERAEMISDQVRKKLVDERGFLALCRDSAGRLRNDETIDMAVAAYRHQFMASAEQASAHRLLEKDFDTAYGPRCVPTSNQVYFNRSYGRGQLGGVWTRAVLAHAVVCYRASLAGIGSLILAKVGKLVTEDAPRLGGSTGAFPQWVDASVGEIHGTDSDPVAAARFVEALLEGELGLPSGSERTPMSPALASSLGWVLASDLWLGEPTTIFLGRAGGKNHLFSGGGKTDERSGSRFVKAERVECSAKGVFGVGFHTPGQVICLGNSTSSSVRPTVTFSPRAAELAKRLSTPLETYEPSRDSWTKTGSIRVFPTMSFEASLAPNEWKAFRVSTP